MCQQELEFPAQGSASVQLPPSVGTEGEIVTFSWFRAGIDAMVGTDGWWNIPASVAKLYLQEHRADENVLLVATGAGGTHGLWAGAAVALQDSRRG